MKRKNIIVKTSGPIYTYGGLYGPLTIPYKEEVGVIMALLKDGMDVYEVLEDGSEVKLDLQTIDNVEKKEAVVEPAPKKEESKFDNFKNKGKDKKQESKVEVNKPEEVVEASDDNLLEGK